MADYNDNFTSGVTQNITAYNTGFVIHGPAGTGLTVSSAAGHVRDAGEQSLDIWAAWNGTGAPTGAQRCGALVMCSDTGQAQGFVFVLSSGGGSPNAYNLWRESSTVYRVYRRDNGAFTQIGADITVSTPNGTAFTVWIEAQINGGDTTLLYNINGTTGSRVDSSGSRLTSGLAGGGVYNPGAGPGNAWFDDLDIDDLAASGEPFDLVASGAIAMSAGITLTGNLAIRVPFNLVASGAIALSGGLSLAGDLDYEVPVGEPFDFDPTAAIALQASMGVTGDLMMGEVFDLVPTAPIALQGGVTVTGNVVPVTPFNLEAPLEVGLTASMGVTGDLQITVDEGEAFDLQPVGGLTFTASMGVTGNLQIRRPFALVASGPIAMQGSLSAAGNLSISTPADEPFDLEPTGPIALQATLTAFSSGFSLPGPFALVALGPVAMQASVGVTGVLRIGIRFNMVITAPIAMQASLHHRVRPAGGDPAPGDFYLSPIEYPTLFTRPAGMSGVGGMMGM